MSTGGKGYQVEVESLRAFAAQVRGLLKEFEDGAGGAKVHGQTGLAATAFGTFPEAEALHAKYGEMRDGLKRVLDQIQESIDEAQRNADRTAMNYEEQEHDASKHLRLASDGWSTVGPSSGTANVRTAAAAPQAKPPTGNVSPAGSGEPGSGW
ncbi:hypothetical protein [Kitasatospora cheerisanensis]|uniref:Uncharacterized protein n=1 Tax=Kitasatospora cheerisanensis KCTC 2395 TaxID=1348663 RepID=A0A066YZI1_9ACTN|nr:hypothetical protein [Kitasatospora cheerisanensis]KDN85399.1 hypothetical protein KCH_29800 [Kitasatospora cheerisanensis KCTC 2395]